MYLGLDIGTSSIKAVLIDTESNIIGQSSYDISFNNPRELWSEQDPDLWWHGTLAVIDFIKSNYKDEFGGIRKIGLSGQMHGATLLDKNNNVLRPAILWNDTRSYQECTEIAEQVPEAIHITANELMPGFTAPKLLWVKKNEKDIFNKLNKVLLPKDYIRFKLTGEFATDLSDASGTSWLNVCDRVWSEEMLESTSLELKHMPKLYEGTQTTGHLKSELTCKWGLKSSIEIIAGAGDNAASAASINIQNSGEALLSLGTSGVYFIANNRFKAQPESCVHTMCHCFPNKWHHMSVHLSSAQCLNWFANNILKTKISKLLEKLTNRISSDRTRAQNNIIFLPYLNGERTPHNDPHIRGMFYGLDSSTTELDMLQSVLEGVAFAFLDGQNAMQSADIPINKVYVVGGGSRSYYWGEIIASVLMKELSYFENSDVSAALGAAKLCGYEDDLSFVNYTPRVKESIEPNMNNHNYYLDKYNKFKKLYRAVSNCQ